MATAKTEDASQGGILEGVLRTIRNRRAGPASGLLHDEAV